MEEVKSSEATSSEVKSSETAEQDKSKPAETQQDFDFNSFAKGDFSSAAGVWRNGLDRSFILNNDGTGTMTTDSGSQETFKIQYSYGNSGQYIPTNAKEPMGGAAVIFIKITENDERIQNVESDTTRSRIHIGQGEPTGSDVIFYRSK